MKNDRLVPLGPHGMLTTVDLFCGAGGVSTGIISSERAIVTHAINHSDEAIAAHSMNHPATIHLTEDITDVESCCKRLPTRINHLHASMECTSFSKAKGGQSRSAKSRSLADYMELYILHTNCDFFTFENVEEFLKWGPLIQKKKNGKKMWNKDGTPVMIPDPKHEGIWFREWVKEICDLGFEFEMKKINSADLGAYTSRTRLFGIFYKPYMKNTWPVQTHSKKGDDGLMKWKACRDILEFENKGNSIFGRSENENIPKNVRRPLKDATLKRIAYGFRKYVLPNLIEGLFISKTYGSGKDASGINDPIHSIRTKDCHSIVKSEHNLVMRDFGNTQYHETDQPLRSICTNPKDSFLSYNMKNRESAVSDMDEPVNTITTKGSIAKVDSDQAYIVKQYSTAPHKKPDNAVDPITNPLATITTRPNIGLVQGESSCVVYNHNRENAVHGTDSPVRTICATGHISLADFVMRYFGGTRYHDLEGPLRSILTSAKDYFIQTEQGFLTQAIHGCDNAADLNKPLPTILTRDEKVMISIKPSSLSELGQSEKTAFFKEYFPDEWEILDLLVDDIKMRYLNSRELARAQGFPEGTYLGRTETLRKHHIGNSVTPIIPEKWLQAIYDSNVESQLQMAV